MSAAMTTTELVQAIDPAQAVVKDAVMVKVNLANQANRAMTAKRPRIKGYREDRSGFGFVTGKLIAEEREFKESVILKMKTQNQARPFLMQMNF